MPAAKNGNHIYITEAGNTLQSVYEDINDTTWFTSGNANVNSSYGPSGCYCFLHPSAADTNFEIRNGGELTIGKADDPNWHEELCMSSNQGSTANHHRIYVRYGGTLNVYGRSVINCAVNIRGNGEYEYIFGKVNISGSGDNKPIMKNYLRTYIQEQQNNDTYSDDTWEFRNCVFGPVTANSGYHLYIYNMGKIRSCIFKNIELSGGASTLGYGINMPYDVPGSEKITFEDCHFYNIYAYSYRTTDSVGHLKNCTIDLNDSVRILVYGPPKSLYQYRVGEYGYQDHVPTPHQDVGVYIEDCIFCDSGANQNAMQVFYSGRVLIKGCDFRKTAHDDVETRTGGMVRIWSGNTFARGVSGFDIDFNGSINWVNNLDLTIQDEHGDPVSGANIVGIQQDGKERYMLRTGHNGHMMNKYGISGMLLSWKHQYGNNPTTNAEVWSSGSTGGHNIYVFKDGYRPYNTTYIMGKERDETITLKKLDSYSSTF